MPIKYIEQGHDHLDAVPGRQRFSAVIRSAQSILLEKVSFGIVV